MPSVSGTEQLVRDCARKLADWDEEGFPAVWRRIGELGPRRAIPILLSLLHDTDPAVRSGVVEILGEVGGRDEIMWIVPLLDDEVDSVSRATALACGRLAADPRTTLYAFSIIDRHSARGTRGIARHDFEVGPYRAVLYSLPLPDKPSQQQEVGSRLLYGVRIVDKSIGSFVALIEVRREAARPEWGARLDLFDGQSTTRMAHFGDVPSAEAVCAAVHLHMAQRCAQCNLFARAEARFCRGCGSPLAGAASAPAGPGDHVEAMDDSAITEAGPAEPVEPDALATGASATEAAAAKPAEVSPGAEQLARQLASEIDANPAAIRALHDALASGAPATVLRPLLEAFASSQGGNDFEHERLATLIADVATARGAITLAEVMAWQRGTGCVDTGIAYRALARLFPRAAWHAGDSYLVDARLSPMGDTFSVATRSALSIYNVSTLGMIATRSFFAGAPAGVAAGQFRYRERPEGFADGWLVSVVYGPRCGLAAETLRFAAGSIERLEPSLVSTLFLDPFSESGVALQLARGLDEPDITLWALRWDERAVAIVENDKVHIHEADSGAMVAFKAGHRGPIRQAAFDPNSTKIATADDDELRLWSLPCGVMVRAFPLEGRQFIGFDRGGRLIVARSEGGGVSFWNLYNQEHAGDCPADHLSHLSPDGFLRCAPLAARYGGSLQDGFLSVLLGPAGTALIRTEIDVKFWDGRMEHPVHFGRYEPTYTN
jgi:hypothetical protein